MPAEALQLLPAGVHGKGWASGRGKCFIKVQPNFVSFRVEGFGEDSFAQPLLEAIDSEVKLGRHIVLAADFELMDDYASPLRSILTKGLDQRRASVPHIVVLARSKLVTMGLAVASLVLTQIKSTSERGQFDAMVRAAQAKVSTPG